MGAVFRAKDLGRDYKKIVENAVKDLSPDTKDNNRIIKLPDSWEGVRSEEKLNEVRGQDKAEDLLKNIKAEAEEAEAEEEEEEEEEEAEAEEVNLTNDERKK